jgi:hypothetical protein
MLSEFELMNTQPFDQLVEKWQPVLNHDEFGGFEDSYRKKVTASLLENQERAMQQQYLTETSPTNALGAGAFGYDSGASNLDTGTPVSRSGGIAGYDPVLISLVRRAMPNLLAYDIAGVQPMSAPTGLIFALRANYTSQTDDRGSGVGEALFQEPYPPFSGNGFTSGLVPDAGVGASMQGAAFSATGGVQPDGIAGRGITAGGTFRESVFNDKFRAMLTGTAEGLGGGNENFSQMAFTIDRIAVEARTRALKAEYSTELAQDLKAVHGLDAETELSNILSTEILAEINRELIRTLYFKAKSGAQQGDLNDAGVYNLDKDSDGRWSAERFRGLMFQIERECNTIAKETRRGKGNFIVVSSDVASALAMGGFLNISPALNVQLDVDDTGRTFAGVLNGRIKVYIDPYLATNVNTVLVGYKGTSPYDAGLFYCPYVPLQMVRAVGENTFQPKIGFKTRYGMVANPFAEDRDFTTGGTATTGNQYYRLFKVDNIHGTMSA